MAHKASVYPDAAIRHQSIILDFRKDCMNAVSPLGLCCVAKEGMQMDIECVLFCNVRKSRKMLDVG